MISLMSKFKAENENHRGQKIFTMHIIKGNAHFSGYITNLFK